MPGDELSTVAGTTFLVSDALGNVRPGSSDGLYASDTRYLSRYDFQLVGDRLVLLRSGTPARGRSEIYATNAGNQDQTAWSLEIHRKRDIGERLAESITLTNRGDDSTEVPVRIALEADFADIFEVRATPGQLVSHSVANWNGQVLVFHDQRREGDRRTEIDFNPAPDAMEDGIAHFSFTLRPGESRVIEIGATLIQPTPEPGYPIPVPVGRDSERSLHDWLAETPVLKTDDATLLRAYLQAIEDIATLEIPLDTGEIIPAAGLPWYLTIFGRDSIITSLQCLLTGRRQAIGTLRTLAALQSHESNDFRDAEPGKIVHEIRFGELAASQSIPHTRYYGTADATPLWIILLAATLDWDASPELLNEILPYAEAAMDWIDTHGDPDGDGFIEYQRRSPGGLINQGWKDSVDSVRFADGRIAEGPIALIEVQGYAFAAKQAMADLYDRIGKQESAASPRDEANRLKQQIHNAFWMPSEGYYAMALDGRKQQVTSITSNPGHLLWSGAVDPHHAEMVAQRLLAPDMFSGWGIRTMATTMGGYNPFSYHNGSVWPHDNSLIAAGLARYGLRDAGLEVINAMLDAASHFDEHRLPELFCGYGRDQTPFPVDYPVACSPQAWAAGSVILMLQTLAGISVSGGQLTVNPLDRRRTFRLDGVQIGGNRFSVEGSLP